MLQVRGSQKHKIGSLTVVAALAGLLLVPLQAAPAGDIAVTSGKLALTYAPKNGQIALTTKRLSASGKGALLQVGVSAGKTVLTPVTKQPASGALLVATLSAGDGLQASTVALINSGAGTQPMRIPLKAIGLNPKVVHVGFDARTNEFIGPISGTLSRPVPGQSATLISLAAVTKQPVLLCTSTPSKDGIPGAPELVWAADKAELSGTSTVPAGKRFELRLFAPPVPERGVAISATTDNDAITTDIMQTRHMLRVFLEGEKEGSVSWRVAFAKKPALPVAIGKAGITAEALSPRQVRVRCDGATRGLAVQRSDGALLALRGSSVTDTTAPAGQKVTYSLIPITWSGPAKVLAQATVEVPALPPLPPLPNVYLSDIKSLRATNGWNGDPRRDLSIEDNPIRIRGETYAKGMGVHAKSELVYKVRSHYARFVAVVGLDDEKNESISSVDFAVFADAKKLFATGLVKATDERIPINVEIPKGAKEIRLVVGDGGNGVACDHADWANAGFVTSGEAIPEPFEPEAGYKSLFDGKTLAGWKGDATVWSVAKGVLRGRVTKAVAKTGSLLAWQGGQVENAVVKMKVRIPVGDAGIVYRGSQGKGYRLALAANAPACGGLQDTAGRGALAAPGSRVAAGPDGKAVRLGRVDDTQLPLKPGPDGWLDVAIFARGNHIVQQINGLDVVEFIDKDAKGRRTKGDLSLQVVGPVGSTLEVKDICLKALPIAFGETVQLFNGKDMTGWTTSSDAMKKTWTVKDGAFCNAGKPAGYIRTTADYDNYIVRLQMRHLTKGNSGVLVRMTGKDKIWPRSLEAQGMINNMGDIWNIDKFPMKTDPKRLKGRRTQKMHGSSERALGQWNVYEIMLNGGDLEIRVNDLLQNAATECWETPGKICLQSEGAKLEFRNIVVLPINRPAK